MLKGLLDGKPILANHAKRGEDYRCPACHGALILKKGRKIIHHFAHRPPTNCSWAKGETLQHLAAKSFFYEIFSARGLKVEIESVISVGGQTRRVDVLVYFPNGTPVAIELQHTPIPLDELEARAKDYASVGFGQIWVPFLRANTIADSDAFLDGSLRVEKYSPRPFERWIHGFHMGSGMWMYDPSTHQLLQASLRPCRLWVDYSDHYDEYGEEHSSGGFYRDSKRWKTLELAGPHDLANLRINLRKRTAASLATYNWPSALVASFSPP